MLTAPPLPLGRPELDMVIFTESRTEQRWPYGVEWLNDAYPVPYWVKQKQEEDNSTSPKAGAGAGVGAGRG